MKTKKTISKFIATASLAVAAFAPSFAQTNLGEACGCPSVPSRPTVLMSTLANGSGDQTATNVILTCDKTWILDLKYYVADGQTITINPGTVIKGNQNTGNAPALIVSRGGKIFATGTESCPIVFTGSADPMDGTYGITNKGKWGGVILLGRAKNNLTATSGAMATGTAGVGFIEGFTAADPRILYGMPAGQENDNDNSGIMTYVSIRHGGDIVGAANEINGLTCGSVGRGTTLRNIEIVSNQDDGIEFFGGTVDLKYASVLFNDDDAFDWDLGWSGRGQFWVAIKTDQATAAGGDNGFESDGDDGKINSSSPLSNPTVYNATFIGSNNINGNGTQKGKAIEAKEFTAGTIRNCVLANYQTGVNFNNDGTRPGGLDAYDNWLAGTLKVECNTFVANTNLIRVQNVNGSTSDSTKLFADGNINAASIPGFDFLHTMNTTTNAVSDTYDAIPNPALTTVCAAAPVDGFFTAANYRGAFEAGKKSWLSNWTINALYDVENGLVACPTDINGDGITNNVDFLQLLGQFNQSCD